MREYFLKTNRIGFSIWTNEDSTLAETLWGEPEVTHFICASGVFTEQEIKDRLNLEIENYEKYGAQYFPIFELGSEKLIGCCGLRPYKNEKDIYEIGFHLRKEYWRKGFGFEAASAMIQYGLSVLHAKGLKAGHHPMNTASKGLLEKLGFCYEADYYYEPTGLYHPSYYLLKDNGVKR